MDQLPNEDSHGITTTAWRPLDSTPASDWRYFTATVQTSAIYAGRSPYTIRVRILVPPNYDPNRSTPYDVLYLLHGGAANYANWTDGSKIKDVVETTSFGGIVVMPEGGATGYYTDWTRSSVGGFRPQWETPWIDANFHTHRPDEQPRRLIAGVSMGGWGAAKYAGQHPDKFTAAAAISGGYATFAGNNPWDLAASYSRYGINGSKFALYSGGNGSGETDFFGMATRFHNRLTAAGATNHRFCTGPGNHADWSKWNDAVKDFLELAYGQPTGACAY